MRVKRRTAEEQLMLIEACHQSGLTDAKWCRQKGIKQTTFYAWVRRLQKVVKIDTSAVVPTVMQSRPLDQDIVRVEITQPHPVVMPTETSICAGYER